MKLFHRDFGGIGKPPLVIIHGLLGSSRNWRGAGADLSAHFHVLAVDLRNHGQSPHASEQSFELLAADVLEFLDDHGLERAHVLGHSLGGKIAMRLACDAPERVESLYVVDIALRPYPSDPRPFQALLRLDLEALSSRREADDILKPDIPDRGTRQFVLMNLQRGEGGSLTWDANIPAIAASLAGLRKSPLGAEEQFDGDTLFIAGGQSKFVGREDEKDILRHFPRARIHVLAKAGHFPHVEDRAGFVRAVREAEPDQADQVRG